MKNEYSQVDSDRSIRRIKDLLEEELTYSEMVEKLNAEGFKTIRLKPWTSLNLRQVIFRLRSKCASWYALSARRASLKVAPA